MIPHRQRPRSSSTHSSFLRIPYESENFPHHPNGEFELEVTWDDILWAAVTVGRPNRACVFQHGFSSFYEAIFRWSMIRMALEEDAAGFLRRTGAERSLDPSERGAVSYFVGMTLCKLFAAKLLDTPWLLHLDVFRPQLDAQLSGRSRPDLIGQESNQAKWHAFECKGRTSPPDVEAKRKAKSQASRVIRVAGFPVSLQVGSISYFRKDALRYYWCDPPPETEEELVIPEPDFEWGFYYGPTVQTFRYAAEQTDRRGAYEPGGFQVAEADLNVSFRPDLIDLVLIGDWSAVRRQAREPNMRLEFEGYQPDGIQIRAGPSWSRPLELSWG